MKLKLVKTNEYLIDSKSIKGKYMNISKFDVIYCTKITKYYEYESESYNQVSIYYKCYNDIIPHDNINEYITAFDNNTIQFNEKCDITNTIYSVYYKIECYNIDGSIYNISIEDPQYKSKIKIPYFNINDDKFTLDNINANTIISSTDPAIYDNINGWNERINKRWISPCQYINNSNVMYDNIIEQKINWQNVIDKNFIPRIYDWVSSKQKPSVDSCLSSTMFRDKYYQFEIPLWKYDEFAKQQHEFYASSGNDRIFIDNIDNIGNDVNIISQYYDINYYGLEEGDIISTSLKKIGDNLNSILTNDVDGAIYIKKINSKVAISGINQMAPILPNTQLVHNFKISTKSNFSQYVGQITLSKKYIEDVKKSYLIASYDNGLQQSIYINDAKLPNGSYKFDYNNLGISFGFDTINSNFIDYPKITITDDESIPISNIIFDTVTINEVDDDPIHKRSPVDVKENIEYGYNYKISKSFVAYDKTDSVLVNNYSSLLSENDTLSITLLNSMIDNATINKSGLLIDNIKMTGYTQPQQFTIKCIDSKVYNVSSSKYGFIKSVTIGHSTINIDDSCVLEFDINEGSELLSFVSFKCDDNCEIEYNGTKITSFINRLISVNNWGSAILYNNSMSLNTQYIINCDMSDDKYNVTDTVTNIIIGSCMVGESFKFPRGSIMRILSTIDNVAYIDLVNTFRDQQYIQNAIIDDIVDNIEIRTANVSTGILVNSFEFDTLYGINDDATRAWIGIRSPSEDELSLDNPSPNNKWINVGLFAGNLSNVTTDMIDRGIAKEYFTEWTQIPEYIKIIKYMQGRDNYQLMCMNQFRIDNMYSYCANDHTLIRSYVNNKLVEFDIIDEQYILPKLPANINQINDIIVVIDMPTIKMNGLRYYKNTPIYNKITKYENNIETNIYCYWSKGKPISMPSSYYYISNIVKSIIHVNEYFDIDEHIINPEGSLVIYSYNNNVIRELDSYATKIIINGVNYNNKILNVNLIPNIKIGNDINYIQYNEWDVISRNTTDKKVSSIFWNKIIETLLLFDGTNNLPLIKYINMDHKFGTTFRYGFGFGKILMEPNDLKNIIAKTILSFNNDELEYNGYKLNNISNLIKLLNNNDDIKEFITHISNNLSNYEQLMLLFAIVDMMDSLYIDTHDYICKSSLLNIESVNNVNVIN